MDWTVILLALTAFAVGFAVVYIYYDDWLSFKAKKQPSAKIYTYTIKISNRDRYRLNIYDDTGKSVLVTSGAGTVNIETLRQRMKNLEKAQFIEVEEP